MSLTRLDITYIVSSVSQYMHTLIRRHLDVVNQILPYLKGSPKKDLLFWKHDNRNVEGFAKADWVGSVEETK